MEKAERIDRVRNSLDSEKELLRRLPEIDAIYDEDIRQATVRYFLRYCPDYFWENPASASGNYHPPDERGKYGTWLHSKRVFVAYDNLSESLLELGNISKEQREAGRAAALIHDTFNYGWPSYGRDMTTSEHDVIAAAVAEQVDGMPQETVELVCSHMGPWGQGKLPSTENEMCFHYADKSAASKGHTPAVYYPAEEITDEWPEVEQIEVEDGENL